MGRRRWGPKSCLAVIVNAVAVHSVSVTVVVAVAVLSSPSAFVSLKKKKLSLSSREVGKREEKTGGRERMEPNTSFTLRGSSKCTEGDEKLKRG